MRLVLDIALVAAVAAPALWLAGVLRWRKLKRQMERFGRTGRTPDQGDPKP